MIRKVLIPHAFENMEEATVGKWLKREGESLREGEALCELITEKTTFDLPAEGVPENGVLRRIVALEKSVVPVGFCIAVLGNLDDELPDVESENATLVSSRQEAGGSRQETANGEAPTSNVQRPTMSTPAAGSRLRATPAARRIAKERGVALDQIAAALPGKVLTEEDVLNYSDE